MRQLQEQAQDFAAALQTNRGNAGGSTKSKKMDVPVLKCPEDINLADFRDWQQRFADYTEVQKIMEECTLSSRQSLLRSGLDPAWTKLWSTGILEIDDRKDDINDIIKKILHYIREHRNPLLDRKEFLERNQHAGESIDVYYSALKSIDESCGYDVNPTCKVCDDACGHGDELQQERLRDRLICGLKDQAIQQKVLAIPFKDLTLKKALEVCRVEAASKETQASLNKSERQVNRLKERSSYKKGKIDNNPLSKSAQKADERCSNCGRKKHQKPDQCWARDKDCNNCGKTGHLKHMCRSEPKKEVNRMTIGQVKTSDDLVKITAKIGNADHQEVEWLPDTGAECDVITADCLKKVGTKVKDLRKDKAELCGPDQGRLKSLGKVTATLEREGMKYKTELHVLEKGTGPILSKAGCIALGLIPTGWPHVVNKLSLSSPDEGNGVDMLLKSQSAASIREQLFQEFPEDPKLEEVRLKTETDPVLLKLKEVIVDGFPEHKANLDTELRDYWGIRDKLSIVDGLIMYGSNRIVIPTSLRRQVLDELHAAHQEGSVCCSWQDRACIGQESTRISPTSVRAVTIVRPTKRVKPRSRWYKELSELKVGDIVRVQHGLTKKWNLIAEILEIRPRGRSYLVKTESGRLYWRNRRYLKLYAPPIGVAKDISESQEEVKQQGEARDRRKPLSSSLLLLSTQTPNYIIFVSSPCSSNSNPLLPLCISLYSLLLLSKTLWCTSLF
ncbi:Transposon Tf2-6 polyprotein [Caligus rogercresseyi]|uniref:Transposon Tf2-6 polyprotein n=1 Tax=Caligus rogercresseyi TaxID=217165 RepID=A0A7T8HJY4_CALRO|nr:Transposon Tf2-6 polyprotein [Caligus rogercresseyi]